VRRRPLVLLARSAMKQLIEPEQVAELVLYLCSPAAAFISGASLSMDGAWTAQ
jgi:3-hydroxybutyrate dehydrogenase